MTARIGDRTNLSSFLERNRGRRVYLHEVAGNNGDELILKGSQFLLRRAGCPMVAHPEQAEIVMINGGFKSDFWPFANEAIHEYSSRFPGIHLAVLPSSYLYKTTDLPSLLRGRTAPVTLFARELASVEHLDGMRFDSPVEVGLDHDTAFALCDDPRFRELGSRPPTRDLLIVERGDAESATGHAEKQVLRHSALRSVAVRVLPTRLIHTIARGIGRFSGGDGQAPETDFVRAAFDLVRREIDTPITTHRVADVSRRSVCGFDEFCNEVASSRVIVSTRLHVAILAAIIGRRTFVVAGNNHKIPGIYDYSMARMSHVTLVDSSCRVIR